MTAEPIAPRSTKMTMAVWKLRRIWVRRFVALASLIILESARGRPAVDTVSRRA
jgi:hypothetical protein